jgi:hypothetical protein
MKKLLGYTLLASPLALFLTHAVYKHGWLVVTVSLVTTAIVAGMVYLGLRLVID